MPMQNSWHRLTHAHPRWATALRYRPQNHFEHAKQIVRRIEASAAVGRIVGGNRRKVQGPYRTTGLLVALGI